MAKVGAKRAAELTGKSKSTIQRAMKSGKVSYEVLDNNRRVVDVSELERVFGLDDTATGTTSVTTKTTSVETELQKAKDILEMERMKMRIRSLEDQLHVQTQLVEDMKSQRDNWQKQAQQILITSQHSQKEAEGYKKELKDREDRARQIKQKRMQQNMAQLQKRTQNQNTNTTGGGFWSKLTGKTGTNS